MKKIIAVLLAMCVVFSFAGCSNQETPVNSENNEAASDLSYITEKGTMVVGITEYEPMNYKEEGSDKWTGFDTEFALLVGEKLGVNIEFKEIDWDNKIPELDSKAIDCVWNGMTLTDEVKSSMNCTKPYVINAQVVVMAADKASQYSDIESLKGLSFVAESGSAGEAAIKENGLDEKYTAVTAQSDALMEVASGSADACVIDITMANAMTGEGTSYSNLASGISLTEEEYGIGFRKDSDVTAKVNEIIEGLKVDGSLSALAEKYSLTLVD